MLPFGIDIIIVAAFSVAIYYYDMYVRLTPEEVASTSHKRERRPRRKKASRSSWSACRGGFETRPYETSHQSARRQATVPVAVWRSVMLMCSSGA